MGPPEEWVISSVCEQFHCLPEIALRAIENDPDGLIFKILDLRGYKEAKERFETKPKEGVIEASDPSTKIVEEITWEIAREELAKRQGK